MVVGRILRAANDERLRIVFDARSENGVARGRFRPGESEELCRPDEIETARGLLREIIGEVVVRPTPDGTFAYPMMNSSGVNISGAQERT